MSTKTALVGVVAVVLVLAAASGCSLASPAQNPLGGRVKLDLSDGPKRSGVPDLDPASASTARFFEDPQDVEIVLPGGHVFREAGAIDSVDIGLVMSPPDQIDSVRIMFDPESADEVHARMRRYADEFALDTDALDDWVARRGGDAPASGAAELRTGRLTPFGPPNGPTIEARVTPSFSPERPFVAYLYFGWGHLFVPPRGSGSVSTAPPGSSRSDG